MNNFHMIVQQIIKFDGRRAGEFWSGILRFVLTLACTTRQLSTSYKRRSGRQNLMPTRRHTRATWGAANQDLYSVLFFNTAGSEFSVVRRFRAKHRLREQDTDNRRGQPFARYLTGVRRRPFGRSTSGRQARG